MGVKGFMKLLTLKIFAKPSKATPITLASLATNKLQNGVITLAWTTAIICSVFPQHVKLVTAHAASFCDLKSP